MVQPWKLSHFVVVVGERRMEEVERVVLDQVASWSDANVSTWVVLMVASFCEFIIESFTLKRVKFGAFDLYAVDTSSILGTTYGPQSTTRSDS